jgi:hypothetical protein
LVTGAALDDGASQPKDLRALVEWSLANPSYRLGFPRVLEARFIADTLSEQIRTLRIFGTIGILLYAAFSVTDRAVIPDIWPQAVVVRCCILAVSVISFAVTLRPSLNALARDVIVGLLLLLSMAGLMLLFTLTESVNKACFFDGTLLVLAFGTVCLPMRFSVTTASTLACVVLVGVCVLSSTDDVACALLGHISHRHASRVDVADELPGEVSATAGLFAFPAGDVAARGHGSHA